MAEAKALHHVAMGHFIILAVWRGRNCQVLLILWWRWETSVYVPASITTLRGGAVVVSWRVGCFCSDGKSVGDDGSSGDNGIYIFLFYKTLHFKTAIE